MSPQSADPGARPEHFDPRRPVAGELRTSIGDGFTLTAVGDCIISRPMSQLRGAEPAFGALLDLLACSTVAYGNLETVVVDPRTSAASPYSWAGDWPLVCEPAAVADLRAMGFGLLSRANNHALDWGIEGMRDTDRHLDAHGLTHAGCGDTLALARAAAYRETPAGRVGLVSCVSTYRETTDALDQHGASRGRPGVNPLPVKRLVSLPADIYSRLAAIRDELAAAQLSDLLPELEETTAPVPSLRYQIDPAHLDAILRQVRQGKQFADLLVVSLHAHEAVTSPDPASAARAPERPAAFVYEFGRRAIDAGADAVVVTGIHHVGPIEIHAGRPILGGLGNFFWSDIQTPVPADLHARTAVQMAQAFEHPERATEADLGLLLNFPYHAREETFLSVAAEMRFAPRGLRGLTLHPVDMGYGDKLSRSGLPRLAGPQAARRVLDRLAAISAQHGTAITLRDDPARGTVVGELEI